MSDTSSPAMEAARDNSRPHRSARAAHRTHARNDAHRLGTAHTAERHVVRVGHTRYAAVEGTRPCGIRHVSHLPSRPLRATIMACADGGVPELVEDTRSGLLARLGDVVGLAGLMGLVLCEAELAASLGAPAMARVASDFTPGRAGVHFADLVITVAATTKR